MNCQQVNALCETYLDGELDAPQTLQLQTHEELCDCCRERLALSRAIRASTLQLLQRETRISADFENRIGAALAREASRERAQVQERKATFARMLSVAGWGTAMASAAALAFWVALRGSSAIAPEAQPITARASAEKEPSAAGSISRVDAPSQTPGTEELLDRLIDFHSSPPARLVAERGFRSTLERDVGVRVAVPRLLRHGSARLQGASLVRIRQDQPAAYLRYRTKDNHQVTVYVYNASRMPLHAGLRPRLLPSERQRGEPVYVGHRRGYSIAASNRRGVGYAVATDLDDRESAELVREISSSITRH